jgi:hypothetical protein
VSRINEAWILDAGRTQVGPAIGWGLLVFFGLPVLAICALVTLVGIPLGLGLLAALGLIYALGYGASAWILGRSLLRPPTAWGWRSWLDGRSCGWWRWSRSWVAWFGSRRWYSAWAR